jgi:tetratricopeptide (TPR) repeat protein
LLLDLEEHPQHQRILWLIPIQMLWVNLHIFSSIGIALVAVFLLEKLRDTSLRGKLSLLLLGVIVATLINPYGTKMFYVFYWAINANKNFAFGPMELYSVPEFLRFSTPTEDISVAVFAPLALLMLVSFIPALKRKPVFYFLAGVSTIVVAFSSLRAFAFFGMMALPIISANLNDPYVRAREKIKDTLSLRAPAAGALLQAVLVSSLAYLLAIAVQGRISNNEFGIGLTSFSLSSSTFLRDNNIPGPVFNDADIGSYLIGSLYPQEKVFVDNRFADAYSPSFFRDTYIPLLSDETKWQEALKRYDFNAIIVYQYDETEDFRTFIRRRIYDRGWSFVYLDPYVLILLRNTAANSETIQKFAITPGNIRQRMQDLIRSDNPKEQIGAADIFNVVGMPDEALEIFSNVIRRWPERNNLWLVMGQTELSKPQNSNPAQASAYLKKAIDSGHKTAQAYALLGWAYSRTGEKENAEKNLEQALRLDPSRNDARALLDRVRGRTP